MWYEEKTIDKWHARGIDQKNYQSMFRFSQDVLGPANNRTGGGRRAGFFNGESARKVDDRVWGVGDVSCPQKKVECFASNGSRCKFAYPAVHYVPSSCPPHKLRASTLPARHDSFPFEPSVLPASLDGSCLSALGTQRASDRARATSPRLPVLVICAMDG